MKVKELIEELQRCNPNDQAVIGLVGHHMGQSPCVNIAHLYQGFDWDSGYTYLIANLDITTADNDRRIKNNTVGLVISKLEEVLEDKTDPKLIETIVEDLKESIYND